MRKDRIVKTCDECDSLYFADTSRMNALCPECAHLLYGYEPCFHIFVDRRCALCHWDGSLSQLSDKLSDKT
jgi:hypothetical protein